MGMPRWNEACSYLSVPCVLAQRREVPDGVEVSPQAGDRSFPVLPRFTPLCSRLAGHLLWAPVCYGAPSVGS